MSATADVARMLTLVPWLLERPGASITEIAETFGATPAAIRADLAHLDFCGLPGLGGGDLFEVDTVGDRVLIRMADELRRPLRPTPAEALRLVLTVDAVAGVLGDEVPALHSAIAKIRAALAIPESAADVLDAGPAPASELRLAVRDGLQVALTYQRRDGSAPTDRRVDPWALSLVDGTWYLQGFDHGAEAARTFRLDRILGHEVLTAPRVVAPPDDLPPPAYVAGPDDIEVVLELTVRGRWLLDAVTPDRVEDRPDGGATLTMRTDSTPWLARLVLMAGGEVTVVSPSVVADEVQRLAAATLASY
jgi:predicted DNA-binding transcriptional regulator YafY